MFVKHDRRTFESSSSAAVQGFSIYTLTVLSVLLGLVSIAIAVQEWRGWRGLDNEGRSRSLSGPVHWSPHENVLWKVEIPGRGHSSPVVAKDAVYVTTAYLRKQNPPLKVAGNWAQFGGALLLVVFAIPCFVRRCKTLSNGVVGARQLTELTGLALLVAAICGFVLFGEGVFDLSRCLIRRWIASGVLVLMCLVLCVLYALPRSRLMLVIGIASLLFAGLLATSVPAKGHAYRGGAFSPNSSVMLVVAGLPALVGILILSRYLSGLSGRRKSVSDSQLAPRRLHLGPILKWSAVVLFGLALSVFTAHAFKRYEFLVHHLGEAIHEPVLRWWVVLIIIAVFALSLTVRFIVGNTFPANLLVAFMSFVFCLVSVIWIAERIIAHSMYLRYHLGQPKLEPVLGWKAVGGFGGGCLLCFAFFAIVEMFRQKTHVWRFPGALRVVALCVAAAYFIFGNYLSKKVDFVRTIVCVDRNSGAIRWISEGLPGPRGQMHRDNSAATPTPATDGRYVYAYFGSAGLLCADHNGKILWSCKDLPYETVYGVAISPIHFDGRVIVLCESQVGAYIAAFDCETGRQIWRTSRDAKVVLSGNSRTPLIKKVSERTVILVWGHEDVSGYDILTGRRLWSHRVGHTGGDAVACMVSDDRRLYLAGQQKTLALAVNKLGTGEDPVIWRRKIPGPNCSSPIVVKEMIFAVSDSGRVYCLDAKNGKTLWRKRLKGKYYSSAVAIGDYIYFSNTRGLTTVIKCDKVYQKIAENDLKEPIYASFAAVDRKLIIRTENNLYCIHAGE